MSKTRLRGLALLLISGTLLSYSLNIGVVFADTLGSITRYSIPTSTAEARDSVAGPDGNIWFTEPDNNKIAKATTGGSVTEYSLPAGYTVPMYITTGPGGFLWFTCTGGVDSHAVGKLSTSGTFTMFDLPETSDRTEKAPLPDSSFAPSSITVANGYVWVDREVSRFIQRVSVLDGTTTETRISTPLAEDSVGNDADDLKRYYAQEVAFDNYAGGSIWTINLFNSSSVSYPVQVERIGFDGSRELFSVPSTMTGGTTRMTFGDDGKLWFAATSHVTGKIKHMTRTGTFTELSLATSGDYPYDVTSGPDGNIWGTIWRTSNGGNKIFKVDLSNSNTISEWSVPNTSSARPVGITTGPDNNLWFVEYNGNKISKIGAGSVTNQDGDSDGLYDDDELLQGTSDDLADTDGDGLDDHKESQLNANRDDIFCNIAVTSCAYPDPLQRDIYVETDWMVKPGGGGYSMQPTSTHTDPIVEAFAKESVNIYFDTGQYGGGNEISYIEDLQITPESAVTDLYDFRDGEEGQSQNLATNRKDIWRYLVLGYNYGEYPTSTGANFAGSDEFFVSYGLLKDNPSGFGYVSFDTALSGTIIHELGHSLCLTSGSTPAYSGQDATCRFDGIDSSSPPYPYYLSAMTYLYQFDIVDYSNGENENGSDIDHNDWLALNTGMKDFTSREISPGMTLSEARKIKEYKRKHNLRVVKENGEYKVLISQNAL